ncbi:hypothetical protein SEA_JACKO_27 [Microbacterium phage Jacko]|nr:hypothetical protein SEA_JACKO_27 [Microbacterium phage Jacko]
MTKFNPEFAREVLERRRDDLNRQASEIMLEKFRRQAESGTWWGELWYDYDNRIHALWDQADSYDSVLSYLDDRIWQEKTFEEKVWAVMENWDHAESGPAMVADVLEATRNIALGWRAF